jgi:PAS domain S-box-containing protein
VGENPKGLRYVFVVAKRGGVYAVLIGLLISLYVFAVALAGIIFGRSPELSLMITALAITLAAVGFAPLEKNVQEWTDQLFFRRQFDRNKTMQTISKAMTEIMELPALYELLTQTICQQVRVKQAELFVREGERYVSVVQQGRPWPAASLRNDHPLIKLLNEQKHILTPRTLSKKRIEVRRFIVERGDIVIVPLLSGEELLGFLAVGERLSAEPFYREDLVLLDILAHQAVIGLQRARSHRLSENRVIEMKTVSDIGRVISSALDLQSVLDAVVKSVIHVVDVDRGMLLLYDARSNELQAKAGYGASPEDISRVRLPVEESIFGRIFKEGKPVRQRATRQTEFVKILQAEEYIAVPMKGRDKLIGLLAIDNKLSDRPLEAVNMELLVTFANQTGLAIENAMLYEETRAIKNYNEKILEHMTSGVMTIDAAGKIKTFNAQAEVISGYTFPEVQGRPLEQLWADDNVIIQAVRSPGQNLQGMFKDKNGSEKYLAVSTTALTNGGAGPGEVLAVMTDITEMKSLEKQVRQADRLSILGTMAAALAHEIKNPLASMKLFVQLMAESWQDPNFWSLYGNIMNSEVERLCQVVEDFLGFTRSYELKLENVPVPELLEKVQSLLKTQMLKNNIRFIFKVPADMPQAKLDPQRMTQVLMNLLLNALQAIPAEQPEKRIELCARVEFNDLIIDITDNGSGIPPDNLEKLFTPFFTTKKKGTGLGLSIVQRIVEEHGGKITVRSTVGQCTTFTITIPVPNETEDILSTIEDGTATTSPLLIRLEHVAK